MLRRILTLATLFTLLWAGQAGAQYRQATLTCSPTTVSPGSSVTCTVNDVDPGTQVCFDWNGTAVGCTTSDSNGTARHTFNVPSNATAGSATVRANVTESGQPAVLSASLTVVVTQAATVTTTTTTGTTLPATGTSTTLPLASVAVGLLLVGGALALLARRRLGTES